MQGSLYIVQIIFAVMLIVLILLQAKGSGLGSIFGQDGSVFRSRRGAEELIYRLTIVFAVVFCVLAIISVRFSNVVLAP